MQQFFISKKCKGLLLQGIVYVTLVVDMSRFVLFVNVKFQLQTGIIPWNQSVNY